MRLFDYGQFSWLVLARHKSRTLLLLLAVALGVSSVLILTSLGEGAKQFISKEFSSLGKQLLIVLPGKKETTGGSIPMTSASARDLTIADAEAISRIRGVSLVAPIIAGTAQISANGRSRDVITIGSNANFFDVRQLSLATSMASVFEHMSANRPVIVLGAEIKKTLFGGEKAVGQWVKLSQHKYRVAGVLVERGESLGLDLRNMVIIPTLSAERLFNTPSLFRILVEVQHPDTEQMLTEQIQAVIASRHDGEDDITVISQNSVMAAFNRILNLVTLSVACIAAISLFVAGFLIMNVTYISVSKRKEEIGILKALGASKKQVQAMFLFEAMLTVIIGSAIGVCFAYFITYLSRQFLPSFPLIIPYWSTFLAVFVALFIGIVFSWFPSAQAANQDPIIALRGQ